VADEPDSWTRGVMRGQPRPPLSTTRNLQGHEFCRHAASRALFNRQWPWLQLTLRTGLLDFRLYERPMAVDHLTHAATPSVVKIALRVEPDPVVERRTLQGDDLFAQNLRPERASALRHPPAQARTSSAGSRTRAARST
jgi:hypothetical protein